MYLPDKQGISGTNLIPPSTSRKKMLLGIIFLLFMVNFFWISLGLVAAILFVALIQIQPEQQSKILAVGLVIAAFIYVAFAMAGGANQSWLFIEIAGVGVYSLLAGLGVRYSDWWLMLGWMAHPIWDIGLHLLNNGAAFTPAWYAIACVSFDILIAVYIATVQFKIFKLNKPDYEC